MPTMGQLLIETALPEDMRGKYTELDKKSVKKLFTELLEKHPDTYTEVLNNLMDIGRQTASRKAVSVDLKSLLPSQAKKIMLKRLKEQNHKDLTNRSLSKEERNKRVAERTLALYEDLNAAILEEAKGRKSPYALQVMSGGRGSPGQLSSLVGADLMVADANGDPVPYPIYSSYSEGLTPFEYWASTYGARRGMLDVKLAVADAGFLGKELALATHRQVVTQDKPASTRLPVGLPVDPNDSDNVGAVLAVATGGFPAGTIITPRIAAKLAEEHKKILIASPLTSIAEDGIDAWSAGQRDRGTLAAIGDNIGVTAAQAISEPLSQGMLDSKHRSGAGGDRIKRSGFEYINKLLQGPEYFHEAGPLSPATGHVQDIHPAPQGGHYITIGDEKIYVHPGIDVTVKVGDTVEEGDELTNGVPHPAELVKYRGIGEARRIFTNHMHEALKNSGINTNRRNVEPIVAGLINRVRIDDVDGYGDYIYDDVVPFQGLLATYEPRKGHQVLPLNKAKGLYLEEPALHYTPGTRLNTKVIKELEEFGIKDITTHDKPPRFQPKFERLMTVTATDDDWQTRLGGFYIGRSFQKSVQEGAVSDTKGTSFLPALASGTTFGESLPAGKY